MEYAWLEVITIGGTIVGAFYLVYFYTIMNIKIFLNKDKLMREVLECYKIIVPYATETTSVTKYYCWELDYEV